MLTTCLYLLIFWEGNGNPLQYSCLEKSHGRRSLVGCSPWGCRVGHNWTTSLSLFLSCIGEGNGNPLQCSCLENPRDRRAWWAAVYGVAQSWTWLKPLSSSSSSSIHFSFTWTMIFFPSTFLRFVYSLLWTYNLLPKLLSWNSFGFHCLALSMLHLPSSIIWNRH